jgi:6-phosphogluconolactonase
MKIRIFQDLEATSYNAAELIVRLSAHYIEKKGTFVIALSAGATPRRLYELLATEKYRHLCDWKNIHIFWVDERFVPHTHEQSNFRFINETLLLPASVPGTNIHPVHTNVLSASDSAALYEEEIKNFFHPLSSYSPVFDCILLGIGEDGHTASLFPGYSVLHEQEHFAVPVDETSLTYPRITLSLPVLKKAENIVFLVSGKRKASIVRKIVRKEDPSLPAAMINPAHENLYFFLDRGAASLLSG